MNPGTFQMGVNCFESTSFPIPMVPTENYNCKIIPQGMKPGAYHAPKTRVFLYGTQYDELVTQDEN